MVQIEKQVGQSDHHCLSYNDGKHAHHQEIEDYKSNHEAAYDGREGLEQFLKVVTEEVDCQ